MAGIKSKENGKKGGRPKGSTTKPRMSDYLTEKEVDSLVSKAYELAKLGDTTMLKFVLEQHFGKAIQPVEGDLKGNITIKFDNAFTSETTISSK